MPKAVKGWCFHRRCCNKADTRHLGILVQCDPSIKAIIVKIDSTTRKYIIEDLDEQTLVIKDTMLTDLKHKLDEVRALKRVAR